MEIKVLNQGVRKSVDTFNEEMKSAISNGFCNLLSLSEGNGEPFIIVNLGTSNVIDGVVVPGFAIQDIVMSRNGSDMYDLIEARLSSEKVYQSQVKDADIISELVKDGEDLISKVIKTRVLKKEASGIYNPEVYVDYYCVVVGLKAHKAQDLSGIKFCATVV